MVFGVTDPAGHGVVIAVEPMLIIIITWGWLSYTCRGWLYFLSSFLLHPRWRPQWLLLVMSESQGLNLRYLGQYFACLHDKARTTHPITTKHRYIPMLMFITWLNFGGILLEFFFIWIFFSKFHMYFSISNSIGHILGLVGQIDIKQ